MNRISPSQKIYLAKSLVIPTERGVFAGVNIKKGELIEQCPVIEISQHDTAEISEESLVTYMFYFGDKKERSVIALGFGSLYNHTDTPNAKYTEQEKEKTIEFFAIQDIKKGDEITVSYAQQDQRPLWFATKA